MSYAGTIGAGDVELCMGTEGVIGAALAFGGLIGACWPTRLEASGFGGVMGACWPRLLEASGTQRSKRSKSRRISTEATSTERTLACTL